MYKIRYGVLWWFKHEHEYEHLIEVPLLRLTNFAFLCTEVSFLDSIVQYLHLHSICILHSSDSGESE